MIALTTLAAMGEAIRLGLILAIGALGGLVVACCLAAVAVVVLASRAERRIERQQQDPAGPAEPLSARERAELDGIQAASKNGHKESGSGK